MTGPDKEVAAASRTSSTTVYTVPALDEAAALLADLYAAGDGHGILPDDWAGPGADLPGIALRVVAARYRRAHSRRSAREVEAMYKRMKAALSETGVTPVGVHKGRIVLPRLDTTPPWGWSGEAALTVGFYPGDGWTLELAQARTPVIDVVAPTEAAVAALVADILTGRRSDPLFPRP
ncbi:hypothetical protein SAMN04489712_106126 [Thermomonospora echinospora]|uniref:Uncharacterized protein n=1 Tax=Thermomonospora echinospora TaxID=1992 RepID=A0A1H6AZ98_9ACTN|nr:hypothetical protein [Thermomonospora echinospora]SEG53931.1 hypothetical protein SAMN04489712_106126 [Thermomonospora echinospora]